LISKHKFVMRCFRNGGGSDDDEIPRYFIIDMTPPQASYYLKRIALVNEVQKVDQHLQYMAYRESPGEWWYRVNEDEDGPREGDEPANTESNFVQVFDNRICWSCYHESSGSEMASVDINEKQLEALAKGMDPNAPNLAEPPSSQFSPMQMLNQMTQHYQQVALPQLPTPPPGQHLFQTEIPEVEVHFENQDEENDGENDPPDNEGGDEGGNDEPAQ
jgi:hypothetical protein